MGLSGVLSIHRVSSMYYFHPVIWCSLKSLKRLKAKPDVLMGRSLGGPPNENLKPEYAKVYFGVTLSTGVYARELLPRCTSGHGLQP